jgi:hypothetical protein
MSFHLDLLQPKGPMETRRPAARAFAELARERAAL